ncbi:MAG TPA: asparagine synthase C-terminal domain-containing protein, partial [Anaerolineaceae bacterium]|nr:asparagine synthase C-terminal domain-containing protein [Anaerolineaceae bacterium]
GTIFEGIYELPPAHWMIVDNGEITIQRYWQMDFSTESNRQSDIDWQEEFEDLLINATLIRLRADVPVGAYLSGGLDSSTTTALIRKHVQTRLETYSIAFSDPLFDESPYQRKMAEHLGTQHHIVYCTHADIGRTLPQVIWHTETPILRTAPVPMFMLSRLVHTDGFKVVVTGEGADEFLAGYDIFKEMMVRRFWARDPQSTLRPMLLKKLYPDISRLNQSGWAYLNAFFRKGLSQTEDPWYSHQIRWSNTSRLARFLVHPPAGFTPHPSPEILPEDFSTWDPLGQAQYLEITTFLSPYLLSSQGDRVAMANSVEGRFPFLDYRLVEFCNRLPPHLKLYGLLEKYLLRRVAAPLLPPEIWRRVKRPYRAPIQKSFFQPSPPDYVRELLSPTVIQQSGLFHPGMVAQLVRKAESGAELSEVEEMGLVGILSTQLVHTLFVQSFRRHNAAIASDRPLKRIINQKEGNHE